MIGREDRLPSFAAFARTLWPLVFLILFLTTFRRTETGTAARPDAPDPTDVQTLVDLGDRYAAAGERTRAETAYRRALALDDRYGDLHVRLGELLLTRGDRAGAHAEAQTALRWHPGSARAIALAARSASAAPAVNDQ